MKVSTLIEVLLHIQNEEGDIKVYIANKDGQISSIPPNIFTMLSEGERSICIQEN